MVHNTLPKIEAIFVNEPGSMDHPSGWPQDIKAASPAAQQPDAVPVVKPGCTDRSRACLIAARLRRTHPRAKVLVLDANPDITSKAALFRQAWKDLYPGMIEYRPLDHQSTMGAYVGRLGVKDGKGYMKEWRFVDGKDALPTDDEVKKMRPAQ